MYVYVVSSQTKSLYNNLKLCDCLWKLIHIWMKAVVLWVFFFFISVSLLIVITEIYSFLQLSWTTDIHSWTVILLHFYIEMVSKIVHISTDYRAWLLTEIQKHNLETNKANMAATSIFIQMSSFTKYKHHIPAVIVCMI